MNTQIQSKKRLLALPWPDDVPVLVGEDIDSYVDTLGRSRKTIRDWAREVFGTETKEEQMLYDQFSYVFYEVMEANCDVRDKGLLNFSNVPSTPNYQSTKAYYSTDEVAAWWNEALREVGYEV